MNDEHDGQQDRGAERDRWTRRVVFGVGGLVTLGVAWLIGAAVLPRWWAQRLGDVVDGRLTFGSLLGLVLGFAFTAAPIFVLLAGWKYRSSWKRALATVGVALVVAAPNLATLGIVIGDGNAAHAGERILDVEGPGIRGGSLAGAALAVVVCVALRYVFWSRARNIRRAKGFKAELKAKDD